MSRRPASPSGIPRRPASPSGIPVPQSGYRSSPTPTAAFQTEKGRLPSPSSIPIIKSGRSRSNTKEEEGGGGGGGKEEEGGGGGGGGKEEGGGLNSKESALAELNDLNMMSSYMTSSSDQQDGVPSNLEKRRSLPAIDHKTFADKKQKSLKTTLKDEVDINLRDETKSGVIYITENLIKKTSKEEEYRNIFHLKLIMAKELNRKIKYIENLDALKNLRNLSLAHNIIEKVEKLDCLLGLQVLDLSHNLITKIEGIDHLYQLQVLNLNDNKIESIPQGIGKKLKCLQTLMIARNQLASLHELYKLRPLSNLTDVVIEGNPMCTMPHYKQLAVFQLRSLERIDGNIITVEERADADKRFGQEEVRYLETELAKLEKKLQETEIENSNFQEEGKKLQEMEQKMKLSNRELKGKVRTLEDDLNTNKNLLDSKTSEISKICEKQYKLEQELAFYKLDAKFDEFWKFPEYNEEDEYSDGDYRDGGENTYIGKAVFKPNSFANEFPTKQQVVNFIRYNARRNPESLAKNKEIIQALEDSLQTDIGDKKEAIHAAEAKLDELKIEVEKTEGQLDNVNAMLDNAKAKLNEIPQVEQQPGLTDIDERERIRKELIEKIKEAKELQQTVNELEEKLAEDEQSLKSRENELHRLREILLTTHKTDPNYEKIQDHIASKEEQLHQTENYVDELRELLEEAQEDLAHRIEEIRVLEGRLKAGEKGAQGEIKQGLDGVAEKLAKHVETIKAQMEEQKQQYEVLLEEHEALAKKLTDEEYKNSELRKGLDDQVKLAKNLEDDLKADAEGKVERLLEKLRHYDETLKAERENNTSLAEQHENLRKQMHKKKRNVGVGNFDIRKDPVAKLEDKLRNSENEADRLHAQLERMKNEQEAERHTFEDDLERERRRLGEAVSAAKAAGNTKREAAELACQVEALQAENASFQDRLLAMDDKLKSETEGTVLWDDVLKQTDAIVSELDSGREIGKQSPSGGKSAKGKNLQKLFNPLRQKLNDFCEEFKDEKEHLLKNMDKLKTERDKCYGKVTNAEKAIQKLQAELSEAQGNLDSARDRIKHTDDRLRKISSDRSNQGKMHENKIEDLEAKVEDTERKYEEANQELQSTQTQLDDTEKRLADLEKRLRQEKNQNKKGKMHDKEIENLEAKLEEAKRKQEEAMQELQSTQVRLADTEKRLADTEKRLTDTEKRLKQERNQIKKAKMHEKEIEDLEATLEDAERKYKEAKGDLKNVQSRLVGAENRIRQETDKAKQLEFDLQSSEDLRNQLSDELAVLKDKLSKEHRKYKETSAELQKADRHIKDLEAEINNVKGQWNRDKKQMEQMQRQAAEENRDLSNELTELANENSELKRELKEQHFQIDQAEIDKSRLLDAIGQLEDEVDSLRDSLIALRKDAHKRLQAERDDHSQQIKDIFDDLDDIKKHILNIKNNYEQDLGKANQRSRDLEDTLHVTANKLKNVELHRDQFSSLAQEIDNLRNMLVAREEEARKKDDLRWKYDQLMDTIDKLSSHVAENNSHRQTEGISNADTLAKLNREIAQAQAQISSLSAALTEKERKLFEVKNISDPVIAVQRQEITSLLNQLQTKDVELQTLKQTINELSHTPNIRYVGVPHQGVSQTPNATYILTPDPRVDPRVTRQLQNNQQLQTTTRHNQPRLQDAVIISPLLTQSQENVVSPSVGEITSTIRPADAPQDSPRIYHHYYDSNKKLFGPETFGSVDPTVGGGNVQMHDGNVQMHHHYLDKSHRKKKKTKKKENTQLEVQDEEFCNIPDHEEMGEEMKKLEDKLRETVHSKYESPKERSTLKMDLKELESKVEDAVFRRSMLRRTLPRTLKPY